MKGSQAVGLLLIALGLLYALLYVGWLRRSRKDPPAANRSSGTVTTEPAAGSIAGPERPGAAGQPQTLAWAEGTYAGTNMAGTRHERVATAKFAVRAQGTMAVNDGNVRWERDGGTGGLTVVGTRLLGVSLELDPSGGARANVVRVSWQADNGDRKATAFLPRKKADSAALVSAVQRLMKMFATQGEVGEVGHVGGHLHAPPPQGTPIQDSRPQDTLAMTGTGVQSRFEAAPPQDRAP